MPIVHSILDHEYLHNQQIGEARRPLIPLDILTDEKGQNAPCPPDTTGYTQHSRNEFKSFRTLQNTSGYSPNLQKPMRDGRVL
jgi:hypothetical protein